MGRSRAVTIHDVAGAAGVSVATVSRVLNGMTSVDPDLARRVHAAVSATGYVANPVGRALRRQVSDTWAVIVPDLQNPFFTGVVVALERVALQSGISVMICNTQEELARERKYIGAAVVQRMAGVVIAVASQSESDISPLLDAGIPVVLIDRRVHGTAVGAVFMDNRAAGALAGRHLVERGHTRIACFSGLERVSAVEDRLQGLRAALEDAGVGLDESLVHRHELVSDVVEPVVRELMSRPEPPDALYVTNGPFTAAAYYACQEIGLDMPGDLAFVGTDDERWARMVRPQATMIRQPVARIGEEAARILLDAANTAGPGAGASSAGDTHSGPAKREPPVRILPPELVVRSSS